MDSDSDYFILLQRKEDGQLVYMNEDLVMTDFGLDSNETLEKREEKLPDNSEYGGENETIRSSWTRNDILSLLNLYKDHEKDFKSSSMRNDKIWQIISNKMKTHTSEQIKNKFKYLKQKYVKKKDNMKCTASGAKAIHFEFFEQFDDIFGKNENVEPRFLASSSKGKQNVKHFDLIEDAPSTSENIVKDDLSTSKKISEKKKSTALKQIQNFNENAEKKEKREAEKQEISRELVKVLSQLSQSIDKFTIAVEKLTEKLK